MKDLLNSTSTLQKISQQELRGIEAYKISKMLSIIDKEIQLYNQSHNKLLQECCIKNEKGLVEIDQNGQGTIKADKIEFYNEEISRMLNVSIELNIPQLELHDLENFILTPEDISKIDWWIEKK